MLLLDALVAFGAVLVAAAPSQSDRSPDAAQGGHEFPPAIAARHWTMIVLHHSATSGGSVESIDAVHRRQKDADGNAWLGIGYHFVVGNGHSMGDGEIQPTFRWQKQLPGAHAGKRDANDHGIGICLVGNFDEAPPTEKQVSAVSRLVKWLAARYDIPRVRVVKHQDLGPTLCPGRLFPWEQVCAEIPNVKG